MQCKVTLVCAMEREEHGCGTTGEHGCGTREEHDCGMREEHGCDIMGETSL